MKYRSKTQDFAAKSLFLNYLPCKSRRFNYLASIAANPLILIEQKKGGWGYPKSANPFIKG